MSTEELVQEVGDIFCEWRFGDELVDGVRARWGRLVREIARRDYRFRPHGRECACSDCWRLFEMWRGLDRRSDAEVTDFVPHDE